MYLVLKNVPFNMGRSGTTGSPYYYLPIKEKNYRIIALRFTVHVRKIFKEKIKNSFPFKFMHVHLYFHNC